MYPQVDIRKIAESDYNYSVSIGDAGERHVHEGMNSVAECLHDAATALGEHFPVAAISLEGRPLGAYHVASMEHWTLALAETLRLKFAGQRRGSD